MGDISGSVDPSNMAYEPLAIVGMGMRLPGGIHTAEDFWNLLVEKRSSRCKVPSDRFNIEAFYSPSGRVGTVKMEHGHFLGPTDDLQHFDASFFSMSKKEVEILDPQQRMLLEVVYECMQNAGQSNWRGGNIGCYVGVWGEDWVDIHAKDSQDAGMYRISGGQDFAISNRVSYEYDLKGPSFTIKSGCSSSMIALHEAARAIQAGDCDGAIIAGTNLIISPTMSIAMTEQGVLSPDGACKSFDESADGYARGEAINAIYIKRLSDAIRDGDNIRSVIRATASNCDGKTPGITLPSSESHEAMMRRAYKEACLDPTQTAFVEAHGTGTKIGDPLEATAIARVFSSEKGVYIGSVKPNVGHSEGASGVTSIMKAVLALENRTIPPNINFSTPNPQIPFEASNMKVAVEPIPWPKVQAERASVNSFGIGGANAHVILDSPASMGISSTKRNTTNGLSVNGHSINGNSVNGHSVNGHSTNGHSINGNSVNGHSVNGNSVNGHSTNGHSINGHSANGNSINGHSVNGHSKPRPALLVLSATNTESLRANVVKHQQYIETNPEKLVNIEYNLCNRREHLSNRAFCVTDGLSTLQFSPLTKPKKTPTLVMVFTGQGAQWAEMGKELMADFPSFSQDIDLMNNTLSKLDHPPSWNIKEELLKHESVSCLSKAEFAQPLVTAIQVALVNLLRQFGVKPAAVVGHSSGEIAAAYAANAITANEAIIIAYYRGQVTKGFSRRGGMAAVGLGREDVMSFLNPGVSIACENSSSSVTLSGDEDALNATCEIIKTALPDVFLRPLKVEMAYHSHHMKELGEAYEALLRPHLKSTTPVVPFFSSVSGKVVSKSGTLDAAYWRSNLENPVLFNSAIKLILDTLAQDHLFLEIGPHSALAGPIRQILKANSRKNDTYVTALERGKDCGESILKMIGELYLQHISINFKQVAPNGTVLTDLPLYQWCHDQEYWKESRVSKQWRLRKYPNHEILGSRTVEGNELQPEWRNVLHLDNVPWLRDHQIINDVVFPCAGYLSMACEAIRQISASEDFTFRNIVIQTALVMSDSKSVEMITSLRPVRLTNTLNSVWWDFSISSYNGSLWIKHCGGQIRSGTDNPKFKLPRRIEDHPRSVPSPYPAMKKVGLNYGPTFQGLERLSALPKKMTASATLSKSELSESHYAIHPATIDHCLQLFIVSTCEGTLRNINKLCVPTSIDQLYICGGKSTSGIKAEACGAQTSTGTISGDVVAISGDAIILSLIGGQFSPIEEDSSDEDLDTVAGARLDWKPDLDFVQIDNLIRPRQQSTAATKTLEKFTLLSMIDIGRRISGLVTKSEYLEKFRSWINAQVERASEDRYNLVEDAQALTVLNAGERQMLIAELSKEISNSEVATSGELISRVVKNCEDIMVGKIDGIEVLLPENGLTHFYDSLEHRTDCIDFFTAAGHSKPNLRVLEIGSGTGGTSAVVLKGLTSTAQRMYSTYTYTDISSGFFVEAQERFKDYHGLEYKVLDISKDPTEQGFQEGSYDLIIAANVLHATPSLNTTLGHARKLLAEDGRLFLQELSPQVQFANLIMGVLPGWWLGEADGRANEPYISPERWAVELRKAGFSGCDATVYDAEQPYQFNANIISRPAKVDRIARRITLLYEPNLNIQQIKFSLENKGYSVDLCTIQEEPPAGQDIVSLLELETPMFEKISGTDLALFQRLVKNLGTNHLLWVTRSAQIESYDPRFGMVLGLARTLRSELSLSIATLEIDTVDEVAYNAITNVFDKLKNSSSVSDMNPDYEFVLSKGVVNIGRYHPVSVEQELAVSASQSQAVKLEIGRFGLLQTLRWVPDLQNKVGHDQVIVEPRCAGLNFKDVLVSMGIVSGDGLGLEGSGTVVGVGSEVTDFQVGDRVLYIDQNCFSTRTAIPALRCAKIPSTLSWEEAATMPCVYATVIHSLLNLGRIQKGQSVLIHSACGGIGLAAIQICQNIVGAQIYVTVGNEEKVHYLMDTFGISRDHIFNSRDTSFLPAIKAATNGRGVDVVLNSLSGELLHASWECVAEYGSMVEIGKRDFIGKAQLNMDLFESNRSFFGVDLAKFDAARCQLLLVQMMEFYEKGLIKPIAPMKVFEGAKVEDSFRYMQKGSHIGKIVVTIPEQNTDLPLASIVPKLKLNPDAGYLLVGGLGGLGRAVSTWMVERGARHLIFLSRSAGKSDQDQSFFRELESQDCTVQAFTGSVATFQDVQNAVQRASKPIKGVFQMSMVLNDKPFLEMSCSDWETSVLPKVEGTWHLHHALPKDLDFFVATSSLSGSFGNAGQANYAAANTFLDAFVQYRHSLGLPASVVDIGVMGDIGYVSRNAAIQESLRGAGTYFLQEQDFLDSLNWAVAKSAVKPSLPGQNQLLIGVRSSKSLSDPSNRVSFKRDARMGAYLNTGSSTSANTTNATDQLKSFMSSVETDSSILNVPASLDLVTNEIGVRIYTFMLQPIEDLDVSQTLAALGVDSLVTIEIRNWMKRSFGGLEFSTLEILNAGTIEALGLLTIEGLKRKYEMKDGEAKFSEREDTYLLMKAP